MRIQRFYMTCIRNIPECGVLADATGIGLILRELSPVVGCDQEDRDPDTPDDTDE